MADKKAEPKLKDLVTMLDFFDPELPIYVHYPVGNVGVVTQVKLMDEASDRPWLLLKVENKT